MDDAHARVNHRACVARDLTAGGRACDPTAGVQACVLPRACVSTRASWRTRTQTCVRPGVRRTLPPARTTPAYHPRDDARDSYTPARKNLRNSKTFSYIRHLLLL
jgi:hypothetical protein